MDLSSYRIFETVASLGSMVAAAEALYLTPSAVSHAILKMEKELGFPLFSREKRRITLTTYGQELLPQIRALLQIHSKLDEEISLMRGIIRGTAHIGTFNSTCCFWLSKVLPLFREKYPHIDVIVHEGGYADCEEGLLAQRFDLAFVRPPVSPTLNYVELYDDPLLCISPRNFHPEGDVITISELENLTLILSDDGYLYDVKRFFSSSSPNLSSPHTIIDDSSIMALVASGMGCSILPKMIIDSILGDVNVFPIENSPYRTIGIATHKEQFTTPATRLLFNEIITYVKENPPENTYGI